MNNRIALAFLIAGSLLTACSGSGGNSAMNPVAFTSFSAVQNGQPVLANGTSQTMNSLGTPTTLNPVDTANSTAQLTFSGIGSGAPAISAFSFNTPTSSVSFSNTTIDCTTVLGECSGSSANSLAKVINALDSSVAWNYQSFGYWLVNLSLTSAIAGAISFGSLTPPAGIPTTSTIAVYNGRSGGVYVDPTGAVFTYSGGMASQVNFGTRQIQFTAVPTSISPVAGGTAPSAGLLGVSSTTTLTYAPGSNQFSGSVTATGQTVGGLNGTATGNFYGPNAQEIGGVFTLNTPSSREAMVGGFGGKR